MEKGKMTKEPSVWNTTSIFFSCVQKTFLLWFNISLQKDQELHSSWYHKMFYSAISTLYHPGQSE